MTSFLQTYKKGVEMEGRMPMLVPSEVGYGSMKEQYNHTYSENSGLRFSYLKC